MRTERKIINLYNDNKIFSMKYVISITTEEDLDQFWDFLNNLKDIKKEFIHEFTALFYNFSLSLVKSNKKNFFEIIIEESEKRFYFTLWNKKVALDLHKYFKKKKFKYLYNDNRISTRLKKRKKLEKKNVDDKSNFTKKEIVPKYTFINSDDLQELIQLSDDMQELMFQAKKTALTKDLFIALRSKFSLFALTLRYYNEITVMTTTLTDFSNLLNINQDKFINLNDSEIGLIQGFIYNIDNWLQTMFVNGGADLCFMDNSIKADYDMIANIIFAEQTQLTAKDFDDMFDF